MTDPAMPSAAALLQQAKEAAANAYAPYSKFRVGSVVVAEDGTIHRGANIENAAYGSTICAEGNAISTAAATGVRSIDTVAVACLETEECYPCGNCRQIMREFGVQRLIVEAPGGEPREHRFEEILPHSFGPDALGAE